MNPVPLVLTWAGSGVVAALLLPRLRRRRLAALCPLAAAVVALLYVGGGSDLAVAAAPGGLLLGRAGSGLAVLAALATTLTLILAPPADAGDLFVIGGCGALSVLVMATGSPLVWGCCLTGGLALLGTRWLAAAPSRSTLAAGRVATVGAATLVAAAPFLPVDATTVPPRAHLVGALLAVGIGASMGLLPFGGWVTASSRHVRAAAMAPWVLLLLPAVVLTSLSLQSQLPAGSRTVFGWVILPLSTLTAAWAAVNGLLVPDAERYVRVLVADLALVALGMATQDNGARAGALLLVLTHLCVAPLALQQPARVLARPRRFAWLALSGIPPSPAFWGRFALITGVSASYGGAPLLVTVPTAGALLAVSLRAMGAARSAPGEEEGAPPGRSLRIAAWLVPMAALTVGLFPETSLRALLGVG